MRGPRDPAWTPMLCLVSGLEARVSGRDKLLLTAQGSGVVGDRERRRALTQEAHPPPTAARRPSEELRAFETLVRSLGEGRSGWMDNET